MTGSWPATRTRRAPTCAAAAGSSGRAPARSSRRASWRAAHHAGRGRPRPVPSARSRPFAGPDREGRQVPNIVVGAGPVAARLGAPIRALALRVLPEGRRSIAAFGDEVTAGARRSTGACACAPSTPATVAALCSAAGRRPRPQLRLGPPSDGAPHGPRPRRARPGGGLSAGTRARPLKTRRRAAADTTTCRGPRDRSRCRIDGHAGRVGHVLQAAAGRPDPIPVTSPPAIPDHSPGCDPPPRRPTGRSAGSRRERRSSPTLRGANSRVAVRRRFGSTRG
jgi:hypothetical protein